MARLLSRFLLVLLLVLPSSILLVNRGECRVYRVLSCRSSSRWCTMAFGLSLWCLAWMHCGLARMDLRSSFRVRSVDCLRVFAVVVSRLWCQCSIFWGFRRVLSRSVGQTQILVNKMVWSWKSLPRRVSSPTHACTGRTKRQTCKQMDGKTDNQANEKLQSNVASYDGRIDTERQTQ